MPANPLVGQALQQASAVPQQAISALAQSSQGASGPAAAQLQAGSSNLRAAMQTQVARETLDQREKESRRQFVLSSLASVRDSVDATVNAALGYKRLGLYSKQLQLYEQQLERLRKQESVNELFRKQASEFVRSMFGGSTGSGFNIPLLGPVSLPSF